MPEIKHAFTQGRMEKDLDERLVPNGQYRDAMNIQVSTSEGSDVGTVQNLLGNTSLFSNNKIAPNATCVAAVADEKNDCFYWFVYHSTKNIILKYQTGAVTYVFVDTNGVLGFNGDLITGINIIDDFLLWTDNSSEPKKINIPNCIEGTNQAGRLPGSYHTNLIVPKRNITNSNCIEILEENITVIKKSPKSKLVLDPFFEEKITSIAIIDFAGSTTDLMEVGETGLITFDSVFPNDSHYSVDDIVLLTDSTLNVIMPETFQVRVRIIEQVILPDSLFRFEILSIALGTKNVITEYNCEKEPVETMFSRKFVRFGYRYKFQDGQYSSFSSFTDVLFKPGFFEYNPTKAYNEAMENNLVSLKIRNFLSNETPMDVVQVDILYKESNSPVIYIVDKIKYNDTRTILVNNTDSNYWEANMYEVKSDLIYAVVPSNQLLRLSDNVPRKALAQEITSNRIVYANYVQNYNMDVKPVLRGDYISRYTNNKTHKNNYFNNSTEIPLPLIQDVSLGFGQKSLKSLRNYQLGMTYLDEYNRETPIFTSVESRFVIPKKHAGFKTKIQGKVTTAPPSWAKSFKVYVKETSTEYYNLAMSRVYRAQDNALWLAFPSSERNKVDEETFLILKKAIDSNDLVQEEAKYKVLAIENEAPKYITTNKTPLANIPCGTSASGGNNLAESVFGLDGPTVNSRFLKIKKDQWELTNLQTLDVITEDLFVSFKNSNNSSSGYYEINSVTLIGTDVYSIVLDRVFETQDAELIYPNYPTTIDSGALNIASDIELVVYRNKIVENNSEFKGMFFVKIASDIQSENYVMPVQDGEFTYEIKNTLPVHHFSDAAAPFISANLASTSASNTSNGNSSTGRTNSEQEWIGLLDFGGAQTSSGSGNSLFLEDHVFSGNQIGGFFIDNAFMRGIHVGDSGSGNVGNTSGTEYSLSDDTPDDRTGNAFAPRFGRGIYEENGKHYVEISFSEIGEKAWSSSQENNHDIDLDINTADFNRDYIWQPGNNSAAISNYSKDYSAKTNELKELISKLSKDSRFKIKSDEDINNIYTIKSVSQEKRYNFYNWQDLFHWWQAWKTDPGFLNLGIGSQQYQNSEFKSVWRAFGKPYNRRITYILELDKDLRQVKIDGKGIDVYPNIGVRQSVSFQFLEQRYSENTNIKVSENPAIWETEPKETAELDIYYEASEVLPLHIDEKNNQRFIPIGSVVTCPARPSTVSAGLTYVTSWDDNKITFNLPIDLNFYLPAGKPIVNLIFTRPDDTYTTLQVDTLATLADASLLDNTYIIKRNVSENPFALSWYNCFGFNNGVESNRIRDDFNQFTIDKGARVSAVLEENYEEERRSSGLIYSGIYNSNSGVNNLNQFIQAEKITKDLNPTHGSIQKLFQRRINLIAFCEDKVIKIMAGKDTLFNADGNPNVISTNRVLGDAQPFGGDFGISNNPESFAKDNYRAYFTDRQRGAVLRLSMDGLTPISQYGMSDYFKDNLKYNAKLIGSFDDRKGEYNITMPISLTTVSFKESVNGWSSFKSFVPEQGLSMGNEYYTVKNSTPYRHHAEKDINRVDVDRNTFYGVHTPSSIDVLLNDSPSTIKSFKTLGYEGSQSNVNKDDSGVETGYYNLYGKPGWNVRSIKTDINGSNKQNGSISEFIEKEGKWFNFIKGKNVEQAVDINTKEFSFQGIGRVSSFEIDDTIYTPISGCMDSTANNYNVDATINDGSCTYTPTPTTSLVGGCMDPDATNHDNLADYDDGTCVIPCAVILGCTDAFAINFNPNANSDDGSCIMPVLGCTDPRASNYDPLANVDDGTCIMTQAQNNYSLTIQDTNDDDV